MATPIRPKATRAMAPRLLALTLLATLLGCAQGGNAAAPSSPITREQPPMDAELQTMVRAALADATRRAPPGAAAPTLVRAERVTWPDGSIGCPQPGRMYTMALVPGYRIVIQSGAEQLDYHASLRGQPALCPAGRATGAMPDSRVY